VEELAVKLEAEESALDGAFHGEGVVRRIGVCGLICEKFCTTRFCEGSEDMLQGHPAF